ncbi:MAG TPA: acyltransferase family protein [Acidimicrobiales bacterium]|nr:acyltransferase family protein [Acidimicrobiales bacterium]
MQAPPGVDPRAPQAAPRRVPALDGVRGLAVAAVVAFHMGVHRVRGGLLGVDVFFVLSGYLITGLVLSEWRTTGDVSLARFWARRARRLLPALLLVLVVVAVASRWLLPADQLPAVRGDVLATLFYVANWHSVLAHHGYFAAFAAPSPLLHTWSLAVEEQFYLLWPLGATIALRKLRSSRWLLAISIGGFVTSASLMATLSLAGIGTDRLYYGTDTRAQALFVGDALAGIMFALGRDFTGRRFLAGPRTKRVPALGIAGLAGAASLTIFCLRVDGQSAWLYRGGFALFAVSVAAVIAAVVLQPRSLLARVVSARPLVQLGVISYGVYLWHWPVIVALTKARTGLSGAELLWLRLAVTLVISLLSFHLLERPIREQRWHLPKPAVALPSIFTGLAAVAVVVPVTVTSSSTAAALAAVHIAPVTTTTSTTATTAPPATAGPTTTTTPPVTIPPVTHTGPVRVMIVGDSVAASLGTGIAPVQSAAGIVLSNQGYIGCGIARGGATSFKAYTQPASCLTWPQRWQSLVDSFRPDVTLVLLGRWEVLDRVHDGQWMHIGEPPFDAYLRSELELAESILTSRGGRVAFLTAPCNNHELADLASPGRLPPDDAHRVDLWNQLQADVAAAHPGWTEMVPLADLLCPGGTYQGSIDHVALRTSDGVHFAPLAGRLFTQQLLPGIVAWLRQPAVVH